MPAAYFDFLPTLLDLYGIRLQRIADRSPDFDTFELRGPEIPMMAVYFRVLTGKQHFNWLSDLLEAGYGCTGIPWKGSADAVRKMVTRYQERHPHTFSRIEELVHQHADATKKLLDVQGRNVFDS